MLYLSKGRLIGLFVLCIAWMLSGAGNAQVNSHFSVEPSSVTSSRLSLFTIVGSNTLGARLAPDLVAGFLTRQGVRSVQIAHFEGQERSVVSGEWQEGQFREKVQVVIDARGSSTGFMALENGMADIAASSRPIQSGELDSLKLFGDMTSIDHEHIVAIDGLAIIVHPDNPVTQLTLKQVQAIFNGHIRNWKAVGGVDRPIALYARDDQSGTFDTFSRLVLNETRLSREALRFASNERLSSQVQRDPQAIGFVALPAINKAKAIAVSDGEALALSPSSLTVASEDYPLSRRLFFYTTEERRRKPLVKAFLKYVKGLKGQEVVNMSGYVAQTLFEVPMASEDPRLEGWKRLNLNIRFVDESSQLDNKAQNDVQRLAGYLARDANENKEIALVGYSNPSPLVNADSLSRLRAQNVRWALRDSAIKHKVLTLPGMAVSVADPNSINAERNRRVEVWVR